MPTYAFLFGWFAKSPEALEFATEKFLENTDKGYPSRMLAEVKHLGSEALKHLHKSTTGGHGPAGLTSRTQMAKTFEKYFFAKQGPAASRGTSSMETASELHLSQPSASASSNQ